MIQRGTVTYFQRQILSFWKVLWTEKNHTTHVPVRHESAPPLVAESATGTVTTAK